VEGHIVDGHTVSQGFYFRQPSEDALSKLPRRCIERRGLQHPTNFSVRTMDVMCMPARRVVRVCMPAVRVVRVVRVCIRAVRVVRVCMPAMRVVRVCMPAMRLVRVCIPAMRVVRVRCGKMVTRKPNPKPPARKCTPTTRFEAYLQFHQAQGGNGGRHDLCGDAGIDQGRYRHIPRDARRGVKMQMQAF
jgi:hypothetical protein